MDGRIKQLEVITRRLACRPKKKASALITPYPISNAVFSDEVKGVVLRYMFPCDGRISKGVIDLGKKPKFEIAITFNLIGSESGESKTFITSKKRTIIEPDLKTNTFDKLAISINYKGEKPEDNITEFWVSFLWVPSVKDADVKRFLIEELNNDLLEE